MRIAVKYLSGELLTGKKIKGLGFGEHFGIEVGTSGNVGYNCNYLEFFPCSAVTSLTGH